MSGSPDFAQLVEAIYEAAVIPEKWPAILDQIATVSGSVGGVLTAAPSTAPSLLPLIVPKIRWISSDAIHDIIVRYFEDGWFARCGWTRRGLKLQYPGFVIDSDLFTDEEIEVEPSYRFFRYRVLRSRAPTPRRFYRGHRMKMLSSGAQGVSWSGTRPRIS